MLHWKIYFYLLAGVLCWTFAEEDWSYREEEEKARPGDWKLIYPDCGLENQSPITLSDAKPTKVTFEDSKEKGGAYRFVDYDKKGGAQLMNTGRIVELEWDTTHGPRLVNENNEEYWLQSAMFHFPGEHGLIHKEYLLEVQLVHRSDETGKLVILSVLYAEEECDDNKGPEGLDTVISILRHVRKSGQFYSVEPISPEEIVFADSPGENVCDVFQYTGTLTMPPCTGNVTWIVIGREMCVYNSQMDEFVNIMDSDNDYMWGNYRPTFNSAYYDVMQINC